MKRREINKLYKKLKADADTQIAKRQYIRDAEGRIVIDMTVKDDSGFLSPFSENDSPVIAGEVAEFIESEAQSLPPQHPLTLKISSDCIDGEEKITYRHAINEYYTQRYIANEKELRRNTVISAILFFAGVLMLGLAVLVEYRLGHLIWAEVVDIVAWVLLWESVDISVFQNRMHKLKRQRYLSLMSMKIEFHASSEGV